MIEEEWDKAARRKALRDQIRNAGPVPMGQAPRLAPAPMPGPTIGARRSAMPTPHGRQQPGLFVPGRR